MRIAIFDLRFAIGLILAANCFGQATQPAVRQPVRVPDDVTLEANIQYGEYADTVLDIMYPKAPSATKRPGVVVFHGGGWIQSNKESTMNALCLPYLAQGFVVCNVEYRVARTGQSPAPAPAAVVDALAATKWFADRAEKYNMDVNRLVITGASAGGHLALMVGMATPEANVGPVVKAAAIVNCYGITDVNDIVTRFANPNAPHWSEQWLHPQDGREALGKRLSPMTYIRSNLPPVLTVHGERDNSVPVAQAIKLNWELKQAGVDAEIIVIPNAGHGPGAGQWPPTNKLIFEFLKKRGIIQ